MRRIMLTALAIAIAPAAALAQASGTWAGETQGRGGAAQVTLMIANDGMSGTWTENGTESELSEVSVNGNELSFQRSVEFGGRGAFALTYNGVVDGDELTLTISGAGRGGPRGGGAPPGDGAPRGGPGGGGPRGGGAQPIVLTRQ